MRDPVIAMDGHTYERTALDRWFEESLDPCAVVGFSLLPAVLSPMTGETMGRMVLPNYTLKKAIDEYNEKNRLLSEAHIILENHDTIQDINNILDMNKQNYNLFINSLNNMKNNLNNHSDFNIDTTVPSEPWSEC